MRTQVDRQRTTHFLRARLETPRARLRRGVTPANICVVLCASALSKSQRIRRIRLAGCAKRSTGLSPSLANGWRITVSIPIAGRSPSCVAADRSQCHLHVERRRRAPAFALDLLLLYSALRKTLKKPGSRPEQGGPPLARVEQLGRHVGFGYVRCARRHRVGERGAASAPKPHCLPFRVWRISGSRLFFRSLVEQGALTMVASTMVPRLASILWRAR